MPYPTVARRHQRHRWMILVLFILLLGPLVRPPQLPAQEPAEQTDPRLRISQIDTTEFPTVTIQFIAFDAQGRRLKDLSALTVRENGIPVTEPLFAETETGLDVIFVIDANASILSIDDVDEGRTRLEKVQDSLIRHATQFMSAEGLDHVSVVVPDGESGRFLIRDAGQSIDVAAAVEAYELSTPEETPLHEMLALALTQATATHDAGRAQAIVLFTDGALLDQQLRYEELLSTAEALQIPFFASILGVRADQNEIDNVARLYEPTGGGYLHMTSAPDADQLYEILQESGVQHQVTYRSAQRESGPLRIQVGMGNSLDEASLDLDLEPPAAVIVPPASEIRRAGAQPDTPLTALQPASQPITVLLDWTGEQRISWQDATLIISGEPQRSLEAPIVAADGSLQLDWDIAELDAGDYALSVRLTDALGRVTESEPVTMTITVVRPEPLSPTADAPAATPAETTPSFIDQLPQDPRVPAVGLGLLFILALVFWLLLRRRRKKAVAKQMEAEALAALAGADAPEQPERPRAQLLVLSPDGEVRGAIPLTGENMTIGRDPKLVDIPLADESVARLHARVRFMEEDYWLYDEGSVTGTYLDFNRVGLAPQILQEGSDIHIGRVHLRFQSQLSAEQRDGFHAPGPR